MKQYCFGIDVGGTTVKCGFFNAEGDLLEKWEIPTRTENNGEYVLPDIAQTIKSKIEERGLSREQIEGIGIDIPGPVNEKGEVNLAVNLHWGYVDIVGEMEKMTGIRTKAVNDANAAALGECWKGGGAGHKNLIMVTLGTGVGGGVVVEGKVIAGAGGAGGEIGHVHVTEELTEPCNCGNVGCLEQVASATGLVRLAKMQLEKDKETPSVLRGRNFSCEGYLGRGQGRRRVGGCRSREVRPVSGKSAGRICLRDRSGDLCHRRRRIQSWYDHPGLCPEVLQTVCFPGMQGRDIRPCNPGK